jgi:ferritin-like metal-binding protein YciE
METMDELMLHFLQDIYYAEKRALRGMQKMARAASAQTLKDAILQHREQTEQQITRLEEVFDLITGKRARAKRCEAIEGLAAEADEVIEESKKGPVLDAALIACTQAIEHYEIARYGAMVAWARQAGKDEAAGLLQQTLDEEKQADQKLTELAAGETNPAAEQEEAPAPAAPAPKRSSRRTKAPEPESEPTPPAAPKARRSRTEAKPAAAPRRSSRK